MQDYKTRQQVNEPLSDVEIEQHAVWMLNAMRDGVIFHHYRLMPEESMDAIVVRLRALAREEGLRLLVKRELENELVRYRLRVWREGE